MRYILLIIFIIVCYTANAQTPRPAGSPTQFSTGWFRQGYQQSDSATIIAKRDTLWTPRFPGTIVLWQHAGVDTAYWFHDGSKWTKVGTGSSGTTTVFVDSVQYIHSGSELDTITLSSLAGKTVLIASIHPYTLYLKNTLTSLGTGEVFVNNATGGVKFGTALQNGQKVTFVYKVATTTGTPIVTGVQVNGGPTQTGIVPITIPSQFNPIAGTNMSLTGSYPNITFNSSGGGSVPQSFLDSQRVNLLRAFGNDTSLVFMAGVIRNFCGSGTTIDWQFLNNIDHTKLYFDSVHAISANVVRVYFPAGTKCLAFLCNPDEDFATAGYTCGASYSLDHADIRIGKLRNQSAAVWFNGVAGGIDVYGNTTNGITYDTTTGKFTVNINNPANYLQSNYSTAITSASTVYYPVIDGSASHGTGNKVYFYLYKRSDNSLVTGTYSLQPLVYVAGAPYWTPEVVDNTVGSGLGCGGSANLWLWAVLKKY